MHIELTIDLNFSKFCFPEHACAYNATTRSLCFHWICVLEESQCSSRCEIASVSTNIMLIKDETQCVIHLVFPFCTLHRFLISKKQNFIWIYTCILYICKYVCGVLCKVMKIKSRSPHTIAIIRSTGLILLGFILCIVFFTSSKVNLSFSSSRQQLSISCNIKINYKNCALCVAKIFIPFIDLEIILSVFCYMILH